ncbi:hypothetical protein MCEMRE182_01204 [Candidatus Nanopelagicaceae bacterium]
MSTQKTMNRIAKRLGIRGSVIALALVNIFILNSFNPADASDAPQLSVAGAFEAALPEIGARGIVFQENMQAMDSVGYIRYSHVPTFDSKGSIAPADYWDWKICKTWDDSSCEVKQGFTAEGNVYLGHCLNNSELGCIESLGANDSSGKLEGLTYVGPAYEGIVDTPESAKYSIPRSSTPSIFRDLNGKLFLVRGFLHYSIYQNSPPTSKLDVDIYPVVKVVDQNVHAPIPQTMRDLNSGLGIVSVLNVRSNCLAISEGICYRQSSTNLDTQYTLKLRLPKKIGGWFRGRLSNPTITVSEYNSNSNTLIVSASPVAMPVMGGWVKYGDLPKDFISTLYPSGGYPESPSQTLGLYADASQNSRGFEEFIAWAPYLKDKALMTLETWSFGTNRGSAGNSCLSNTNSVAGMVTTNASVYSSEPPKWDATEMTLDYKIAAPHFSESGAENLGSYTLAISNDVIKCLYGLGQLPASATVSIVYGDSVKSVGTVAVGSRNGWSYFSANGFHYSTPTIRIKFAEPSPQPTPEMTTQASPQRSPKKITITCAKGKVMKKITASKPICPKGYKKVA